jgi:hypothetical protein
MSEPDPWPVYEQPGMAEQYCMALSEDGYLCTEPPGHGGPVHRAEIPGFPEPELWPNTSGIEGD